MFYLYTQYYNSMVLLHTNIFFIANTCTLAGKSPGCCQWGADSSCRVEAGNCYCDSNCVVFGDCCEDVPLQCPTSDARNSRFVTAGMFNVVGVKLYREQMMDQSCN